MIVPRITRFNGRRPQNQSALIQTEKGPIEYAEIGHGAPILVVHGSPGWFDQSLNYILALQEPEFKYRYIIPSRAGYLRTPLSVANTPLEQAHAFATLLTEDFNPRKRVDGVHWAQPNAFRGRSE